MSADPNHDLEAMLPGELTWEAIFGEDYSSPATPLPSTPPTAPTIDTRLFMPTTYSACRSSPFSHPTTHIPVNGGSSSEGGVIDSIDGEEKEVGEVHVAEVKDSVDGTQLAMAEGTSRAANGDESLNTDERCSLIGCRLEVPEGGQGLEDTLSSQDIDMVISCIKDLINDSAIVSDHVDDSPRLHHGLADAIAPPSPPHTVTTNMQGHFSTTGDNDRCCVGHRPGVDIATQLFAIATSVQDRTVPIDRDAVASRLFTLSSALRGTTHSCQDTQALQPATKEDGLGSIAKRNRADTVLEELDTEEGDSERPSKRHLDITLETIKVEEGVERDLRSTLSGDSKQWITGQVRKAYYESIGMRSPKDNVKGDAGYVDFAVVCPDPTPSGRDARGRFWRVDHSNHSAPHKFDFLEHIFDIVKRRVINIGSREIREAKDLDDTIRRQTANFVKNRFKKHIETQSGVLKQRQVRTNVSERRRTDLKTRKEKWSSSPFAQYNHPLANQLETLIAHTSTVPSRYRHGELLDLVNGPDEYLAYPDQLGLGSNTKQLYGKKYNSRLPDNLVQAIHFYDTWLGLSKSQLRPGAHLVNHKTFILPQVYWHEDPLPASLCLDQWPTTSDLLSFFATPQDAKVAAAMAITAASFPPSAIQPAKTMIVTDPVKATDQDDDEDSDLMEIDELE